MANSLAVFRFSQVSSVAQAIQNNEDLQFREVFSPDNVSSIINKTTHNYRDRIFPPDVTLFAFMHQALSSDKSLREGVARVNADRIAVGKKPASLNTAAFSKARQDLSEKLPQELFRDLAKKTEFEAFEKFGKQGAYQGRTIKVVDGSTLLMPDTPENQAVFPQMKSQEEGSGFPIARIVAVFSLLTGCALDLAIGPYTGKETGEHALFRQLFHCIDQNDILLGDAYYSSYFLMAVLLKMGVDFVFESHGSRSSDFRTGQRLARGDHLITLKKPRKPAWMSDELYSTMPDNLRIREVQIIIERPGFRDKKIAITTSFLDSKKYEKVSLGELYRERWRAEIDFAAIKTTMKMDMLRCKKPDMVRKEIWVHLLAYNAIRKIIIDAAIKNSKHPNHISFKATIQTLNHYSTLWRIEKINQSVVYNHLLDAISSQTVGNRPGRHEPRKRKRREKKFPLLHGSRHSRKNRKGSAKPS